MNELMTIEEAIYCMKSYLPDNQIDLCIKCKYYGSCRSNEAHKMAIEALKQPECKTCEYRSGKRWGDEYS